MTEPLIPKKRGNGKVPFQMPSVQTAVSRKSSITNAFVNSVIPVVYPTEAEVVEALAILRIAPDDMRCAYCGDKFTEWDHLRPLVLNRRPTGFISEIANLVPSCGKCNQSKGNKEWHKWMLSEAPLSPAARGVHDVVERVARLETYERWRPPTCVDFEAILGFECWAQYWAMCDEIIASLRKSHEVATELNAKVLAAYKLPGNGNRV